MKRRLLLTGAAGAATLTLAGCAGPQVADYAAERPLLDLRSYFNGTLDAYGVFTDRSGQVVKRFLVVMRCTWQGDEGVLDEDFTYSDGTTYRLSGFEADTDDVVGTAQGEASGNALRWTYTLALPVDGRVWHVEFDDWMYLMDQRVMLNKAVMSEWGVRLGEITLTFVKRP